MSHVQYRAMMSPSDAIIWHIEDDPLLRSTVMAVWELDSDPTPDRLAESLERMVSAIPRLRQRVEPARPRPRWVDVDVDLEQHVVEHDLGGDGSIAQVHQLAERLVRQPFDRSLPQWALVVVRGLSGGRAAIVIKVHHAIADGIGLVLMLAAFTDLEPNPERPARPDNVIAMPTDRRRQYSPVGRLAHRTRAVVSTAVRSPSRSIAALVATAASASRLVWPSRTPLSGRMRQRTGRFVIGTRSIPLDRVRAAAKSHGATVNDAFVTIVVDALSRYHDAFTHRPIPLRRVRVHMPVDVRAGRTANVAGNEFVPARLAIDVPSGDRATKLGSVRGQLADLRAEPALGHVNTIAACVLRLGRRPTRWILGGMMKGVDVLASNVPGPNFPLYVAGAKITDFHAFGPPAGAALNVTLFSYDGSVNLGITTDAGAVTDHHLLLRCFDAAIADMVGTIHGNTVGTIHANTVGTIHANTARPARSA